MKILIAEDDTVSCTMLEAVLTKWGYTVICTDDGDAAFTAFEQDDAPQLALLDWEMPGLHGPDLCRKLRQHKHKDPLYLILLTSRNNSEDLVQGLESGADDYVVKPYNMAELQARINVGRRMIVLQNEMRERERLQGVVEMAGTVCHELNQPLQIVSGHSEILLMDMDKNDPHFQTVEIIKKNISRIGKLTRQIMQVTSYQSKPYLKQKIIDLDQAAGSRHNTNPNEQP
ncbi:MAG: response regulator [Desulfotignum sp.]|nr:response regulator [Desulfobacteraceae bacterium]